jgi:hypothetical protein
MNQNKIIVSALLVLCSWGLFACKAKTPKENIIGDWSYVKTEKTGSPQSEDEKDMDRKNQGLVATFRKNGSFVSVRPGEGKTDTTGIGDYKVSDDGKLLITMEVGARHPDTLPIIQLDSKMLKINIEDSEMLIFKRK